MNFENIHFKDFNGLSMFFWQSKDPNSAARAYKMVSGLDGWKKASAYFVMEISNAILISECIFMEIRV